MKITIALLALLFSTSVLADTAISGSGASASSGSSSGSIASPNQQIRFGDSQSSYHEAKNPASSAYAPSSFSQAPCQGWTSGGASFLIGGATGGGSRTISWCVPLFMATLPGTTEQDMLSARALSEQIMCNTDSEYKKARKQQGNECTE